MTPNPRTPAAILEHQTAAWNAADVEAILQDFAPDAVLTNASGASGQTLSGLRPDPPSPANRSRRSLAPSPRSA